MRMNNKNFPRKPAASAKSAVYHGSQYPAKLLQNVRNSKYGIPGFKVWCDG
jgi:hypothetical protein